MITKIKILATIFVFVALSIPLTTSGLQSDCTLYYWGHIDPLLVGNESVEGALPYKFVYSCNSTYPILHTVTVPDEAVSWRPFQFHNLPTNYQVGFANAPWNTGGLEDPGTFLVWMPPISSAEDFEVSIEDRGAQLVETFRHGECHSSYDGMCIPPPLRDINCSDIDGRNIRVIGPDDHGLDSDGNGIACDETMSIPEHCDPALAEPWPPELTPMFQSLRTPPEGVCYMWMKKNAEFIAALGAPGGYNWDTQEYNEDQPLPFRFELSSLSHYVCHFHQYQIAIDEGFSVPRFTANTSWPFHDAWLKTEEGQDFLASTGWRKVGNEWITDDEVFWGSGHPAEDAATFCAHFYNPGNLLGSFGGREGLRHASENHYSWAERWLPLSSDQ